MKDQLDRLVVEMVARGIRYEDALAEFEKRFIVEALVHAGGSMGRAADTLSMHRNTLRRKLQVYRIPRRLVSQP
jgi:Fis family transcriptional regulator, factor for inversion stimulation protein